MRVEQRISLFIVFMVASSSTRREVIDVRTPVVRGQQLGVIRAIHGRGGESGASG